MATESAATRSAASPAPRAPARGSSFSDEAVRQRRAAAAGRPRATSSRPPATRPAPRATPGGQRQGSQRRQRPAVELTRKASDTQYQNVILTEFIAAVLLVAATPLAKKNQASLSPYVATDLMQLVAITIAYFILALVSSASGGAARFAAWFGGLILITVGLGEAARLAKLLDVLGLGQPAGAAAEGGGQPILQQPPGVRAASQAFSENAGTGLGKSGGAQ